VPANWDHLDTAYRGRLDDVDDDHRWLLTQTLATAGSRRALHPAIPLVEGSRVVDVGCGFGLTVTELATLRPVTVFGVDRDEHVLSVAADVAWELQVGGALAPGSSTGFVSGDAYDLPFGDRSVDAATARFVWQHLDAPAAAAAELARVGRPGGLVWIVDADDGLSISDPPPSAAFTRLAEGLRSAQSAKGGDRRIGRRLAALLDRAGFDPGPVLVLPQAAYTRSAPDDPGRRLLLERFRVAREDIRRSARLTAEEFDQLVGEVAAEEPGPVCEIEAHIAVLASRRE
jgi:SAM-dependent methyltransferase